MNANQSESKLEAVPLQYECPMCDSADVTTTWTPFKFEYGSGDTVAELHVRVPARRCEQCDIDFLDDVGEDIKHEAICKHLGVLSPREIRELRKKYGMSRKKFSEVFGIGEASLNRWENGTSMQSYANDRYLKLLSRSDIMKNLQSNPKRTPN